MIHLSIATNLVPLYLVPLYPGELRCMCDSAYW